MKTDERRVADALHHVVGSLSLDDRLMALCKVAAEIIYANYPEEAHELLAAMAQHDVHDFLLDMYVAQSEVVADLSLQRAA